MTHASPRRDNPGMPEPREQKPSEQAKRQELRKKPGRRWFQFGLSTLLAVTALAAGGAMAWRVYVEPFRHQREAMAVIEKLRGSYKTADADRWLRWVYGQDYQNVTSVDLADCDEPEAYLGVVARLPTLKTLIVGGPNFTDNHLGRLRHLRTLGLLVLDSPSVSDDAVEQLRQSLPSAEVFRHDRRAIAELSRHRAELRTAGTESSAMLRGAVGANACDVVVRVRYEHSAADRNLLFLKTLQRVEMIDLDGSDFGDEGIALLAGLRRVRMLTLDRTHVSSDGLAWLKEMRQLHGLSLENTRVTDAGLAYLATLSELEGLYLDNNNVTDAGLVHVGALSTLRGLGLGGTGVTDAGLQHLRRLTQLRSLWLRQTSVSNVGLEHLRGLSQLRVLDLSNTNVTSDGVAALERELPDCQIRY